jgi:HPt (histidine-containing phosphotransfer) domain-containing protein
MSGVIDLEQLELMTGGDAGLAAEALSIFRSQTELWGRLLESGADPEQWADACHAINGAARSVGAMALGDACAAAETLGRSGQVSRVQASVALGDVKDRLGEAIDAMAELEHQLALAESFPKRA